MFRNRHSYFSLNVQAICDANLRFQNVVARWAGCTHDGNIWRNSTVCQEFQEGVYGDYVLVGDGGYSANQKFLCTPFSMREKRTEEDWSPAERQYHRAQIQTRNTIERAFGLLKRRFPVCGFGMRLRDMISAQKVITVCFILHNLALHNGESEIEIDAEVWALMQHAYTDMVDIFPIPPHIYRPPSPATRRRRAGVGRRAPSPELTARERLVNIYAQRLMRGILVPDGEQRQQRRNMQNAGRRNQRRRRAVQRLNLRRQHREDELRHQ